MTKMKTNSVLVVNMAIGGRMWRQDYGGLAHHEVGVSPGTRSPVTHGQGQAAYQESMVVVGDTQQSGSPPVSEILTQELSTFLNSSSPKSGSPPESNILKESSSIPQSGSHLASRGIALASSGNLLASSGTSLKTSSSMETSSPMESSSFMETINSMESSSSMESVSPFESLPDELMLEVLVYVPTKQLLSLRLLSRRWKTLVLEKPLWRHRRLRLWSIEVQEHRYLSSVVRLAPALDTLSIILGATLEPRDEQSLEAFSKGNCKVRCLEVDFEPSPASNKRIANLFRHRCSTLQELCMYLNGKTSRSNFVPALEAVDALQGLKTLKLKMMSGTCHSFTFKHLRLTNLHILDISDGMARNLLRLGRDTILTVQVSTHRIERIKSELVLCKKITHLSLDCSDYVLAEIVPQLPNLKWVTFEQKSHHLPKLFSWLKWAEINFAGKIHVIISLDYFRHLASLAAGLHSVHKVTLKLDREATPPAVVAQFLQSLTAVEHLELHLKTDYLKMLFHWSPSSVPRLQSISISLKEYEYSLFVRSTLAQDFKTWLPSLRLKFFQEQERGFYDA